MATGVDFLEYVCDQVNPVHQVRCRKMFGEYMIYINDKPIFLVCNNTVFIKILPQVSEIMENAEKARPYDGAREHYILDIENRDKLNSVIGILEPITPLPKKRRRKTK